MGFKVTFFARFQTTWHAYSLASQYEEGSELPGFRKASLRLRGDCATRLTEPWSCPGTAGPLPGQGNVFTHCWLNSEQLRVFFFFFLFLIFVPGLFLHLLPNATLLSWFPFGCFIRRFINCASEFRSFIKWRLIKNSILPFKIIKSLIEFGFCLCI